MRTARTCLPLALLVTAACGGKTPSAPKNTATGGSSSDVWSAVTKGATFTFVAPDNPSETPVVATVTDVVTAGDQRTIKLSWNLPDGNGGLPETVTVSAASVKLDDSDYPAGVEKHPDGRYLNTMDGATCYGQGPVEDAGECEDVCDAWLCVHPTRGLVGGGGTWWPGYGVYESKK